MVNYLSRPFDHLLLVSIMQWCRMTVRDYKWQPTAKADSVWRTLSGQALGLQGRRNVLTTASGSPTKTCTSTPVPSRLPRTVQLGVAKSPLGPVGPKTDGLQKHRGNRPAPTLQHPHTHVPCVGLDWPH